MRHNSEACVRNREPILEALRSLLPNGLVLEIASGTGQHAAWFAASLPNIWQPSDRTSEARESTSDWCDGLPNVREPLDLDVMKPWPIDHAEAVFCANMVHISPWASTLALLEGAARILPVCGKLVLYGPFRRGGQMVASNMDFDAWLKARDPAFGVRDLEAVEAAAAGFSLAEVLELPANNLLVVFQRVPRRDDRDPPALPRTTQHPRAAGRLGDPRPHRAPRTRR